MTIKKLYTIKELGEKQLILKNNGKPYSASYIRNLVDTGRLKANLVPGIAYFVDEQAIEEFNKRK